MAGAPFDGHYGALDIKDNVEINTGIGALRESVATIPIHPPSR
jgi:hypothetical protein